MLPAIFYTFNTVAQKRIPYFLTGTQFPHRDYFNSMHFLTIIGTKNKEAIQ